MLNRDTLSRDPATYTLADGGVAKVAFPPEVGDLATLREQLDTFVCEGAYADALRRIVESFTAVAGGRADTPAVWISGFYGSGKSLLAAMLGGLWTNIEFSDGARAEGLVHAIPDDVKASLKELRTNAARLGVPLVCGGATLGSGADDPVKATLGVIFRAAGLPATGDLRPMLFALWLAEQGVLDQVRAALGTDFRAALETFLLDGRIARTAIAAKPELAPDADTLLDRLNTQFAKEPEATPTLLVEKGRQALTLGGRKIPLTLIVLDEVQQFIRTDPNRTLTVQLIAEGLASKFDGRVLLVCTGQSALGDIPFLEKLLGRFALRLPLGSADINSVIRKTILRKKDTARPHVQAMLEARSGEIDKHLQGSALRRTEEERQDAIAEWPLLASRRKLWERVMQELDRSGLGRTLRSQLRLTLDAAKRYANRPLGVAVPGDFLLDNFGAEALSRQLIGREFFDKVETLRQQGGDGPTKARILLVVYMLARIAGEAAQHGVRATPEVIADLLIEDLGDGTTVRAKVPTLLHDLEHEGYLLNAGGEWRLQSKESADWQTAFNKAQAEEATDVNGTARTRTDLLDEALEAALSGAVNVAHGSSKASRKIERVKGNAKTTGSGLVLHLWNGWDHGSNAVNDIKARDVTTDATLHLYVAAHRNQELVDAIVTARAVPLAMQRMGVPTTDGGKEAKAAMQGRLEQAQRLAAEILTEAVEQAKVMVAGGAEVGAGKGRADAVREAAQRVLDRLYPEFKSADHTGWSNVVAKARLRDVDAIKQVGHPGEPQEHPVCKALLKACGGGRKGSDLRNLFGGAPYGWPREAVDGALRVLALSGAVKVKGSDHKPVSDLASVNDQHLGTCEFTAESRPATVAERIALRSLAATLGITVKQGEEVAHVGAVVAALEAAAQAAGGDAPAPLAPAVPGATAFKTLSGNDLLAELAARTKELQTAIPVWNAAAAKKAARLQGWTLARRLIDLGATEQDAEADAICANRSLLADPDPIAALVAAAADALRAEAKAAHEAYAAAWEAGEARLKADAAWNKLLPEKLHDIREQNQLLLRPAPDLSSPEKIAESLSQISVSQWRDLAAAHPARIGDALADAAAEFEPKMQKVAIPRPVLLKDEAGLDAWLGEIRASIAPHLATGPVLPTT